MCWEPGSAWFWFSRFSRRSKPGGSLVLMFLFDLFPGFVGLVLPGSLMFHST